MNVTITNSSDIACAITDGEWVDVIGPKASFTSSDATVLILGDKPSVREQLEAGLKAIGELAKRVLEWMARRQQPLEGHTPAPIAVEIKNTGVNAVRVILDDGVTDSELAPGATQPFEAKDYIELRELGLVAQDPNQHEAA